MTVNPFDKLRIDPEQNRGINEKIFKAYDIRGIYPDELNESAAYHIGRAFAVFLLNRDEPRQVVVGWDARLSSPVLGRAFIDGIVDEGFDVLDIGEVTTDMVYFASAKSHLPACMITASHNPKQWNGLILMAKDIDLLGQDSGLEEIKNLIAQKNWPKPVKGSGISEGNAVPTQGKVIQKTIIEDYLRHVLSFINSDDLRPMRLVIDTGSGSAGPVLKKLLEKLPLEYKALYFDPDGDFPYHGPDPSLKENLQDLVNEVRNNHYHFGCAFDGDGDRIIFIDENGETVSPSIIGAIMSRYFLSKIPKDKIIYNATVSKIVPEVVEAYGGEAIREKVGHTFIHRKLKEIDGGFACEHSGHYFFRKNFYADSAIISFLVMLDILSGQKKSLSALAQSFSKYASLPEINFTVADPKETVRKIAEKFEGFDTDWLDGLTVRTEDFWINLRPSNTEPLLRLTIEARDELILERVKKDVIELINSLS